MINRQKKMIAVLGVEVEHEEGIDGNRKPQ